MRMNFFLEISFIFSILIPKNTLHIPVRSSLARYWQKFSTPDELSPVRNLLNTDKHNEEDVMKTQIKTPKISHGIMGVIFGTALSFGAFAGDADYKAAKDQADSAYDAAKAHCDTLSGNTKDVCVKQAQANKTKAEADAKTRHEGRDAAMEGKKDKMESQYEVAKEKCDALSGNEKDACVSRAKSAYHQ